MLVGTNLRREFAHARNLIKSVCMRGFSSQICATQPANLCMCAWTDKECSSPVTRVRQILNLSVGTGLGTGIELLYLAIFITLHTIYIIVITCVSCDLEILFYEV